MKQSQSIEEALVEAEGKALDSLSRYKFVMFGYWAGVWVHLNRVEGARRPNPFKFLVKDARLQKVCRGMS